MATSQLEDEHQDPIFSYNRVSQWDTEEVASWMKGLGDSLSQHVPQFMAHSISGSDLLKLSRPQLEYLKVTQVGHQELLLEAIELLASVDNARSRQSTISLTSALSKKASQLVKALSSIKRKKDEMEDNSSILECIEVGATVLQAAKFLIGWLDRFPTQLIDDYRSFRQQLLDNCFILSTTLEGDELDFIKINDVCKSILRLTNGMMSPELFNKPDPVTLINVTLIPHEEKGLGFSIQRTRRGSLVISNVQKDGPAERCGQITEGVELIQINNQNVVGWEVKNVVKSLKACGSEVTLTLRVSNSKLLDSLAGHDEDIDNSTLSTSLTNTETNKITKPKVNLHLALERIPSSPATLGDSNILNRHATSPPAISPLRGERVKFSSGGVRKVSNGWEDPFTGASDTTSERLARQKSHSLSDSIHLQESGSSGVASPDSSTKPTIAYRTEIIGGVVHRVPIQATEETTGASNSSGSKGKKSGSVRKKSKIKEKERSSSTSSPTGHTTKSSVRVATPVTPTSPRILSTSPPGTNVGGEIEQGKAIFSDPTDVVIEGKATKQITVSSTAEPISFTRDSKLRGSGKKTDPALLVPCFQLKEPDYEGWVNKLGGSGLTPKNWRKRWFVLKDYKVYYYKTTFDIQALGIIDLRGYKIEKAHDIKKKNGFKATKSGARTYYFFTDTADEMMRWIDVMTESSEARLDESDDQKQPVTAIRGGSVESCDEVDDDDIK